MAGPRKYNVCVDQQKDFFGLHLKGNRKPLSSFKWEWHEEIYVLKTLPWLLCPEWKRWQEVIAVVQATQM